MLGQGKLTDYVNDIRERGTPANKTIRHGVSAIGRFKSLKSYSIDGPIKKSRPLVVTGLQDTNHVSHERYVSWPPFKRWTGASKGGGAFECLLDLAFADGKYDNTKWEHLELLFGITLFFTRQRALCPPVGKALWA